MAGFQERFARIAAVFCCCATVVAAQAVAPKVVPLKPVELKSLQLRPGRDFGGATIPASGWQARVGTQTVVFVDLSANGTLEPEQDGFCLPPSAFVVPIPPVLLLGAGQFDVAFDGVKSVSLTKQVLGGAADALVGDAALVSELRVRAGVRPAVLDKDACAACEKHCQYLKLNKMTDGGVGLSPHHEDPAKPGYTAEGERAGRGGCLGFGEPNLKQAMLDWYATAWHGVPIVDPSATRFGVAQKNGVSIFYACEHGGPGGAFPHPPDGAREIPTSFGERGEAPNPVPGTQYAEKCGFPILVMLDNQNRDLTAAIVKSPKGERVKGTISCPAHPATPEWPTNSDCALFIPSAPLAPATKYSVRFEFKDGEALEWSFTTAAK
jgi:hypothetical protein